MAKLEQSPPCECERETTDLMPPMLATKKWRLAQSSVVMKDDEVYGMMSTYSVIARLSFGRLISGSFSKD